MHNGHPQHSMVGLAFLLLAQTSPVQPPIQAELPRGFCFAYAAQAEHVNPAVLMAIAWHESHFWPWRAHRNSDGSTDYGLMQINSKNLPSLHLNDQTVMATCANIQAGARLYHRAIRRYGNTWAAVGAYHSTTPPLQQRYAQDIERSFQVIIQIDADWRHLRHWIAAFPAWWLGRPLPPFVRGRTPISPAF